MLLHFDFQDLKSAEAVPAARPEVSSEMVHTLCQATGMNQVSFDCYAILIVLTV